MFTYIDLNYKCDSTLYYLGTIHYIFKNSSCKDCSDLCFSLYLLVLLYCDKCLKHFCCRKLVFMLLITTWLMSDPQALSEVRLPRWACGEANVYPYALCWWLCCFSCPLASVHLIWLVLWVMYLNLDFYWVSIFFYSTAYFASKIGVTMPHGTWLFVNFISL